MRSELSLKYKRMLTRKHEAKGGKNKEEHAFYAGAQFKGKCNHCGKYGHRIRGSETVGKRILPRKIKIEIIIDNQPQNKQTLLNLKLLTLLKANADIAK
jgi:hypothetical protein